MPCELVLENRSEKGRRMNETGARMTEKGGRREGKRVQMVVSEGGNCHAENGVLMVAIATILGKNFFLPRAQKFPREHDKRDK